MTRAARGPTASAAAGRGRVRTGRRAARGTTRPEAVRERSLGELRQPVERPLDGGPFVGLARRGRGEREVVDPAVDPDDGDVGPDERGPLGHVPHVEHAVRRPQLLRGGRGGGGRAGGAAHEHRLAYVEPARQPRLLAAHRRGRPCTHREACERLPGEVVVPLPAGGGVEEPSVGLLEPADDDARQPPRQQPDERGEEHPLDPRAVVVEPRAVEDEGIHPARVPVGPARGDQAAGRVAEEDDLLVPVGPDGVQRHTDLLVVVAQVAHVAGPGPRPDRATARAQVEGVEVEAGRDPTGGVGGVEEVVGEAVEVEHRAAVRRRLPAVDEHRLGGVVVGGRAQGDAALLPRLPEDVGHRGAQPREGGGHGRIIPVDDGPAGGDAESIDGMRPYPWRSAVGAGTLAVGLLLGASACDSGTPDDAGTPGPGGTTSAPAAPGEAVTFAPGVTVPETRAGQATSWVLEQLAAAEGPSAREAEERFAEVFLEQVPAGEVAAVFAQLRGGGPFVVEGYAGTEDAAQLPLAGAADRLLLHIGTEPDGRMNLLFFEAATPVPKVGSLDELESAVADLGIEASLLIADGETCEPVRAREADVPRPVGSVFKLYVLDAVRQAVADGELGWE